MILISSFVSIQFSSFNSLKVRLNECSSKDESSRTCLFQFLKGAIKWQHCWTVMLSLKSLNSLKVRLNDDNFAVLGFGFNRFNSLKVRLNVSFTKGFFALAWWFQFLKGAIKCSWRNRYMHPD